MDLTEQINQALFDGAAIPLKPSGPEQGGEQGHESRTLKGISEENAYAIKRAKEIVQQEGRRRESVKALRVELAKQINGLENPYKTLETALTIIELLLDEPVYLKPLQAQIEAVRAKGINDPLAETYASSNLQALIDKLEQSYGNDSDNAELRRTIRNLKERKSELEQGGGLQPQTPEK